jgi:glycosyltransferase involved in cell wall biosynthesis
VSEFHRGWAVEQRVASPEKIVAVPNGIARARLVVARTRDDVRRELGVGAGEVLLATVGRLAAQKGIGTLLRALPRLRERDVPVRVALVGEGPLRGDLERLVAAEGLGSIVSFLGFRRDVADIVDAADIVVAPSLWEGLSISVLEAMALGRPIVTTSIGSNVELVEDGVSGVLVPPDSPELLADAVERLARDPAGAAALGAAAKERYRRSFTEDAMKKALWEVYRPLLERKNLTAPG